MSDNNQFELAIYMAALHLPAAERTPYLTRACGADTSMRSRLETKLNEFKPINEDDTEDGFDPEATVTSSGTLLREELLGETIGRYKLVEKLGEGGFGSVYVAEQKEPVERRVAFKITKLGMDTKQVISRFKLERQALAMMDHPAIAKVLDAGSTENGRPYFVMELVSGVKITEFCDQHKLSTHKRLELFMQVCLAIEHAHQKGIIHRDIKPSNILVSFSDGKPAPKVIDFGIAKATQGDSGERTMFTQADQFIGTPAYMSPEQADLKTQDIDTRTDIYSLGVVLYELLTAETPLESKNLLSRGFDEMRKMIREFEPQRPSLRLGGRNQTESTTTAKRHGTDAFKLIKIIKGDLDWVVMRCLEKDRERRYQTAGGLASDIQRFLDDRPVEARSPSEFYRFRKMLARNKLVFAIGIALWLTLLGGLFVTTMFVIREAQQRDAAEIEKKQADSSRQIADAARDQAEADSKQAQIERQKAEAARKQAELARQQAEKALAQAESEHNKANSAERQAKDSQREAELAANKVDVVGKEAASEASLRQQAEATASAATLQADQWGAGMSNMLAGLDQLGAADASRVTDNIAIPDDLKQPWVVTFLLARGNWHSRTGDYTAAILDFSKIWQVLPGDGDLFHRLGPLLAESGGPEKYSRQCGQFLKEKQPPDQPSPLRDCLLKKSREIDPASLAAVAQSAVSSDPHPAGWQLLLSLAEYRQGHFAGAVDWASKALSSPADLGDGGTAQAKIILAMAHQQLNHAVNARSLLAEAKQIMDSKMPKQDTKDLGSAWPEWIEARVLMREAQGLIPAGSEPPVK